MKALSLRSLPVLFLALFLGACATTSRFAPSAAEVRLADLMASRLELARDVAWIKFQNDTPIYDPRREAELLATLVAQASRYGLPDDTVAAFFQAQMKASRIVQGELIAGWKRGGTLPALPPRDLRREIRPQLDRLSEALLQALSTVDGSLPNPGFASYTKTVLVEKGFSASAARAAAAPLSR